MGTACEQPSGSGGGGPITPQNNPPATGTWNAATAIAVSGADVYIAGEIHNGSGVNINPTQACYWKNEVITDLPSTEIASYTKAIAVSGADVYIAGYGNGEKACYWENGVKTDLPSTRTGGRAMAIAVSGADVYIAGETHNGRGADNNREPDQACYWINQTIYDIPLSGDGGLAKDIAVSGADVYIAGSDNDGNFKAFYWKNGVKIHLQ
jgi:hypothetical protein